MSPLEVTEQSIDLQLPPAFLEAWYLPPIHFGPDSRFTDLIQILLLGDGINRINQ